MKDYWKSLDEQPAPDELPEDVGGSESSGFDRRSFLKLAGFSLAATTVACQRSVTEKAIPFLVQPEGIVPGRAYWLASTCGGCSAGCGVLVKCRDGRPIKLEGNPQHPINRGGLCAVGQASILELYDSQRLANPLSHGKPSDWQTVDAAIRRDLGNAQRVRFVTSTNHSPTARFWIDRFLARFPDARRVDYDALSASSIREAHQQTHGTPVVPRYRFDRADVVVSIGADFLGTWISPVEFTAGYASRRKVDSNKPSMSYHAQFESIMTLSGSKADRRVRIHPSETTSVIQMITDVVNGESSGDPAIDEVGRKLARARGTSLVVCGSARVEDQIATNRLNESLGNYGATIDVEAPSHQRFGSDVALEALVRELTEGTVDALFIAANLLYDFPELEKEVARVPLVVSFSERIDETSRRAHYVCPDHHFLESWSDNEPVSGVVSVTQPAIAPLRGTRSLVESLAAWCGEPNSAYELVKTRWREEIDPRAGSSKPFETWWDETLHDGFATLVPLSPPAAGRGVRGEGQQRPSIPGLVRGKGQLTLVLYPKIAMLDGRHAHNPWLHELPDPISKVTWDNYASLSPKRAKALDVDEGDVVRITANGTTLDLPAFIQPGQHDDVVAVAIGYGRLGTDRFTNVGPRWLFGRRTVKPGETVGKSVAHLRDATELTLTKLSGRHELASTQRHHSIEGRPIIQETTVAALAMSSAAGTPESHTATANLYEGHHEYKGHRWAMAVDLTACTGCSGCVIGCQAENNVPVVGKDEVLRQREMHWIRIDRYYSGNGDDVDVVHQPLMCHHCGNAPCESVCPVLATVHSDEGLNQQVYNRCVGTRYCENNCPYKVRRFNWFDYPREDRLQNMVLNPDVTVRSRGVMEKCSMCIQRIEEAKIVAKQQGIPLADAIQVACQQSCPAQAIVFGDLNDSKSRIAQLRKDPRHYVVFGELNVDPGVGYLRLVRNRTETREDEQHA